MKITKNRLKQIIKEEFENSKKKGREKFYHDLKSKEEEESDIDYDVERALDYFFTLINSPEEVTEFMSLLDDALVAAVEDGKLGSVDGVKRAIVEFIKQIAPKVSVAVSTIDMTSDDEEGKEDSEF